MTNSEQSPNQQLKQNNKTPDGGSSPDPRLRFGPLDVFIMGLLFFSLINFANFGQSSSPEVPYSQFKQQLREGNIASVVIRGDRITGNFESSVNDAIAFTTTFPPLEDRDLFPLLEEQDVEVVVRSDEQPTWVLILINLLPWMLIIGLFLMASRALRGKAGGGLPGGGMFSFTRSKARLSQKEDIKVSYDDIAGLSHAKQDLGEIIDFLKHPEKFRAIGAHIPKGILMIGPPGTGKTLLAKATAFEAGVPFFSITGSEFVEMFVGVGASRVRDMFTEARKVAPALIFIDEIDSVGRARSNIGIGNDEREQTLNQILAEMDGFNADEAVVVLAATNRPDILDTALTRPGRFDRKVVLDLPQREARLDILKVHSRKVPMAEDVDLDQIAAGTVGFSGADLANLINEAALLAARDGNTTVGNSHLERARDKVVLGEKRESILSTAEKQRTAYHEAGHALTAYHMPHADALRKVSIIPRGMALGYTEQTPKEDKTSYGQHYLEDRIAIMLGGRSAEKLVYDEVSSGAANDLQQATRLARHMVTEWGMNEKLGALSFEHPEQSYPNQEFPLHKDYSEHTAEMIDEEVRKLVSENEARALATLREHRQQLDQIAAALLEKETISDTDIEALLGPKTKASA
ncbi:MAG: ATP-dependent zinc metalloprotease FtsH [Pseudomonadales bacterium]|nr:ATP-dependent zinc metalloprotease FtsH [Pseudomonadales bacterium]